MLKTVANTDFILFFKMKCLTEILRNFKTSKSDEHCCIVVKENENNLQYFFTSNEFL